MPDKVYSVCPSQLPKVHEHQRLLWRGRLGGSPIMQIIKSLVKFESSLLLPAVNTAETLLKASALMLREVAGEIAIRACNLFPGNDMRLPSRRKEPRIRK